MDELFRSSATVSYYKYLFGIIAAARYAWKMCHDNIGCPAWFPQVIVFATVRALNEQWRSNGFVHEGIPVSEEEAVRELGIGFHFDLSVFAEDWPELKGYTLATFSDMLLKKGEKESKDFVRQIMEHGGIEPAVFPRYLCELGGLFQAKQDARRERK